MWAYGVRRITSSSRSYQPSLLGVVYPSGSLAKLHRRAVIDGVPVQAERVNVAGQQEELTAEKNSPKPCIHTHTHTLYEIFFLPYPSPYLFSYLDGFSPLWPLT